MVFRVWHHHGNTVFRQGAEQGAAYGDLRGVENYPSDVFDGEGERFIAAFKIDDDLTAAMRQSGRIRRIRNWPAPLCGSTGQVRVPAVVIALVG
jgi:hypothetical protein